MELRQYLRIISARWWIAVTALAVTVGATAYIVEQQPWIYESSGTYVIRPRTVDTALGIRAWDSLVRGAEIPSTYAAVARSGRVRELAADRLGPSGSTSALQVRSQVIAGTNIVSITAQGQDPRVVHAYAAAVGEETVSYVGALHDAFELVPLDSPQVPSRPVGPRKNLTIALGGALGLMVGIGITFVSHYLTGGASRRSVLDILDAETEAYNRAYLQQRFNEEVHRTKRTQRPFCVGVLRAPDRAAFSSTRRGDGNGAELQQFASAVQRSVRPEDVLGYLGAGTFVLLLPETRRDDAEKSLKELAVTLTLEHNHGVLGFRTTVSVTEFGPRTVVHDDELDRMVNAG